MNIPSKSDVVILGGGLAGLTLGLQIKKNRPATSVVILEKRSGDAPDAAHKVGESTVELGTHYLREVLGLKDYLDRDQLPKHGLRFFFSPEHKNELSQRVELGPRERLPIPSHQLDRGILENDLEKFNIEAGNEVILGADVRDVELGNKNHQVKFKLNKEDQSIQCRWVVDATGRRNLLKRKLKFDKDMDHNVNAVWFRFKEVIDVDDFSENLSWRNKLKPGLRRLSTVHMMDKGYWVWFIPLVSDSTSVGIVADEDIHPLTEYNNFEKAMQWMHRYEPVSATQLEKYRDKLLDFRLLKHYAYHSGRFYDASGWAVTGEAGAFLDPFYSPGTDFISYGNGWVSDLVIRDLEGEDIDVRATVFEQVHNAFIENWLPIWQHKYQLFGNTQVMVVKIFWDWATYWAVSTPLFTNNGFTNIKLLKQLFSGNDAVLRKLGDLNRIMQQFYIDWGTKDNPSFTGHYLDPLEIGYLHHFHSHIDKPHNEEELLNVLAGNMKKLEKIAAEIFRKVSHRLYGTSLEARIDPYKISTKDPGNEFESIHAGGYEFDPEIESDVRKFWFHAQQQVTA